MKTGNAMMGTYIIHCNYPFMRSSSFKRTQFKLYTYLNFTESSIYVVKNIIML